MPTPRVLILGSSFAGLEALLQLRRWASPEKVHITLVDRTEVAAYVPMAHEAVSYPGRRHAGAPLGRVAARHRADHVRAEIASIDAPRRQVTVRRIQGGADGKAHLGDPETLTADVLIVALGARLGPGPSFSGQEHLLTHRTTREIDRVRAALAAKHQAGIPRVVVIGGGLTGVELAGELARLAHPRDAGSPATHLTLLTGGSGVLPKMAPAVRTGAREALERQGVVVEEGGRALGLEGGHLHLDDGRRLPADLCFWGGGIQPLDALAHIGLGRTADGFLRVASTLCCLDDAGRPVPGVFALGDAVIAEEGGVQMRSMHGRLVDPFFAARKLAPNVLAYLDGAPPRERHRPFDRFPSAISVGGTVLFYAYGLTHDLGAGGAWFRREAAAWWERRYL